MPARPRKEIVDSGDVGFYHCFSRCVRRAFLCGQDPYTGKNYDHRKQWVEDRLAFLAGIMAVDITSHAVMDNHLHVVCRIRPDLAQAWSAREVARRWLTVCPGKRNKKDKRTDAERKEQQIKALMANKEKLADCRQRLSSLSWTMKFLKEYIARRANEEDGCGGVFWEGRFKSTRLLDLFALLLCTMYVDLNMIRADIAKTPETSIRTSAYRRIAARQARSRGKSCRVQKGAVSGRNAAAWLAPIDENAPPPDGEQSKLGRRASDQGFLPMSLDKYLQLLDWTGRQLRHDKRRAIPAELAPILERLDIGETFYLAGVEGFEVWYSDFAGQPNVLAAHASARGGRWFRGAGKRFA